VGLPERPPAGRPATENLVTWGLELRPTDPRTNTLERLAEERGREAVYLRLRAAIAEELARVVRDLAYSIELGVRPETPWL
jgi:hypothetical protein